MIKDKLIFYIKGLYHTVPVSSHTRQCSVIKYPERIHFNIPLYEKINKKPVVIVLKDSIEIIFTE